MTDCDHPKCHESMLLCLNEKVSKKDLLKSKLFLWGGITAIGIPLMVTGIKVWSGQESDFLRFASKSDHSAVKERVLKTEENLKYIKRDVREIRESQKGMSKDMRDIKDLLRKMEKHNGE